MSTSAWEPRTWQLSRRIIEAERISVIPRVWERPALSSPLRVSSALEILWWWPLLLGGLTGTASLRRFSGREASRYFHMMP
jgi:hypothetical protein